MCGSLYQSDLDRISPNEHPRTAEAEELQRQWRAKHNAAHSAHEHSLYQTYREESGCMFTPEAAYKLAPYGFVPVVEMVLNKEVEHACNTAPRIPSESVLECRV